MQRIYSDGSIEEPMLYGIEGFDTDWKMGRRGFLLLSAIGIGALSGCIDKLISSEPEKCGEGIRAHTNTVNALSFSPDGKLLASGSSDGTIKIWEMPLGKLLETVNGRTNADNTLSFSPDGKLLASRSSDDTIKLWEMPSGKLCSCLSDPSIPVVTPTPSRSSEIGGGYCSCNKICTCVPVK